MIQSVPRNPNFLSRNILFFLLIKEAEQLRLKIEKKKRKKEFSQRIPSIRSLLPMTNPVIDREKLARSRRGRDTLERRWRQRLRYQLQMKVDFRDRGGAHTL